MTKTSAGILLYKTDKGPKLLLVHPGGPYFARKDDGAWTIPKGEFTDEDPLAAAIREFEEEIGVLLPGPFTELTPIKQKSGKIVYAWAAEGDVDASNITSNTFTIQWPPKSGKMKEYPEVDRAQWMSIQEACRKIIPAQTGLITELAALMHWAKDQ